MFLGWFALTLRWARRRSFMSIWQVKSRAALGGGDSEGARLDD